MDEGLSGQSLQEAFAKLTPADQRDIAQMVQNESQKAQIQSAIHDLADVCWKKCIGTSKISSGKMSSSEESCTRNCVDRFMDSHIAVLNHLQKLRANQ